MSHKKNGNEQKTIQDLDVRLEAVERNLKALILASAPTMQHAGTKLSFRSLLGLEGLRLLTGWSEISQFCGKRPSTLRNYVKTMNFPVYRWGRSIYSHPLEILSWMGAVADYKKKTGWKYPKREEKGAKG